MKIVLNLLLLLFFLGAAIPPYNSSGALAQTRQKSHQRKATKYACPMHPEVVSSSPGKCHKCGMMFKAVASETKQPFAANVTVYDQDGKRLKFYTELVKDKTVAINFIFTTCTTICPPLTATFRRVQQQLGERVGNDVNLISISVDPTTDTPERLKDFSDKFKAGPGWTFVTGDQSEINALLTALGVAVANKNDHTPMLLVGNDAAGYWTRTYGLAPPTTLVKVITDAADLKRTPK